MLSAVFEAEYFIAAKLQIGVFMSLVRAIV